MSEGEREIYRERYRDRDRERGKRERARGRGRRGEKRREKREEREERYGCVGVWLWGCGVEIMVEMWGVRSSARADGKQIEGC